MPKADDTDTKVEDAKDKDALDTSATDDADKSKVSDSDAKDKDDSAAADDTTSDSKDKDAGDGSADDDASKADDDATAKEQRRVGYQLRQIRQNDPYVSKQRKALQEEYVNEANITDDQREIRQIKADNYLKTLETSRAQLVADQQTVASEIPMFDPNSDDFRKDLYDRSLRRYGRDSLEQDDEGNITGYKIPLLEYLREEADSYRALSIDSDKSKPDPKSSQSKTKTDDDAKMDAASEDAGGSSPTTTEASEKDPTVEAFLQGFDSVK